MKKNLTFEEEKRAETLYVLFNGLLIAAVLLVITRFLLNSAVSLFVTPFFDGDDKKQAVKAFFDPVMTAIAFFIPFFIYNLRAGEEKLRKLFRKPEKNIAPITLFSALGTALLAFAVPTTMFFVTDAMITDGYVITENLPYYGDSTVSAALLIVFYSAVTGIITDIVLRGVITEKLRYANAFIACFLTSFVASSYAISFISIPTAFLCSIFICFVYMKASSIYASMLCNFILHASLNTAFYLKFEQPEIFASIARFTWLFAVAAVIVIAAVVLIFGHKITMPKARNSDEEYLKMSVGESLKGMLKSMGFWILIFVMGFQILYTYLDKPEAEEDNQNQYSDSAEYKEETYAIGNDHY